MADTAMTNGPSRVLERALAAIKQRVTGQHAWVALALTVIVLAHFLILDYGNQFGDDEWPSIYTVSKGTVGYIAGRPLEMLSTMVGLRLLGVHQTTYYVAHIALKLCVAFVVYLLVRHFSPDKPLFAFACASLYLTYLVNESILIRSNHMVARTSNNVLFPLLALYFHFTYMARHRRTTLLLSLAMAAVAGMAYDGVFPMLTVLPVALFAIERDFSRPRVIGLVLWLVVLFGGSLRIVLPLLGLTRDIYASSMSIDGLDPATLALRSAQQLKRGLLDPLVFERPTILPYRLPVVVTVSAVLLGLAVMRAKLSDSSGQAEVAPIRSYIYWLLAGIGAAWLGFSAVLPFVIARFSVGIHSLAIVGEAVAISAAIWLVSHLVKHGGYRWLVRYVAVGFVVAYGTAQAGRLQAYVGSVGGEWENSAYYLRSLAHIAPSVKEDTLVIYVHRSAELEPPIYHCVGYEYAMRYLYDDVADGIWLKQHLLLGREWQARNEGIQITTEPEFQGTLWARDHLYGWDEMIFVGRDETGRAVVLDELPPQLYTEERASLYDPYARIEYTFVSERVQQLLPPLVAP